MTQPFLQPFYVSYVNGDNQEIDEELVFAKSEPDAMRQILTTFEDTKFVYVILWIIIGQQPTL